MTMTIENENTENTADTSVDTSVDTTNDTQIDAPVDDAAPKSMLEAIEAAVPDPNKPAAEEKPPEDKPAVDPAVEAKPETEEDVTKMPEGLTPKAQERFQKLANDNKQVRQELEQVTAAVEPFRQTLQENNVSREQFDLATSYIGLINKGDLRGALQVMDQERAKLALLMGEALPGVDALAEHADLREAVDTFQITEKQAIELARHRSTEQAQQQARLQAEQRQREEKHQTQQREEQQQQFKSGLMAVDEFTKSMMKSDLDFAKVEAILLPQIPTLLKGAHPSDFVRIVESAYKMVKASAGAAKQAPSVGTLRPTGGGSPSQEPKSMMDAMFPNG